MEPFTLPALGEGVTEASVNLWLKNVGDSVSVGEPLVEVSTDKVDTEIESPISGVLVEVLAEDGDVVQVGDQLAMIDMATATPVVPVGPPPKATVEAVVAEPIAEPTVAVVGLPASASESSPATQVASAPAPPPPASPSTPIPTPVDDASGVDPRRGTTEKVSRLRMTIAARMMDSIHGSAQLTTVVEIDVTAVATFRNQHKAAFRTREGISLSFLPFFASAAVGALQELPVVNATLDVDAGTVTYPPTEHLGIAVDTERGLIVPVIRDAGTLSITQLAHAIADLATRTREGTIGVDDLTGGTFTLTNTGSRGALFDTPILNSPQSGILGTGAVVERPIVIGTEEKSIAIRSMAYFALSYDHRVVDGADAARYLGAIKKRLESGDFDLT